jgi:hypothetical protein
MEAASEDQTNSGRQLPGIYSHVHAQVRVDPDIAHLSINLRITAKNETGATLQLTEPYYLPEISGIFNLSAKDDQGPLKTINLVNGGGVRFRPEAVIEPDAEYSWEISFECRGAFELQGRSIAGPYKVTVQPRLGPFLVSKHEFDYEFLFPKPKPKRAWLFRTVHVIQVADRAVNCRVKGGLKETRCKMKFSLGPGETLRLFMATRYEFASLITLVLAVIGTLIVKEIVDLIYEWLKRWLWGG